jgi:hypothetical protein
MRGCFVFKLSIPTFVFRGHASAGLLIASLLAPALLNSSFHDQTRLNLAKKRLQKFTCNILMGVEAKLYR